MSSGRSVAFTQRGYRFRRSRWARCWQPVGPVIADGVAAVIVGLVGLLAPPGADPAAGRRGRRDHPAAAGSGRLPRSVRTRLLGSRRSGGIRVDGERAGHRLRARRRRHPRRVHPFSAPPGYVPPRGPPAPTWGKRRGRAPIRTGRIRAQCRRPTPVGASCICNPRTR